VAVSCTTELTLLKVTIEVRHFSSCQASCETRERLAGWYPGTMAAGHCKAAPGSGHLEHRA